jgi:hypothetical protein
MEPFVYPLTPVRKNCLRRLPGVANSAFSSETLQVDRAGRRRRFAAGYVLMALVGTGVAAGTFWLLFGGSGSSTIRACGESIPSGRSVAAAWDTTELFVADVMLNGSPRCGYDLSTRHLRAGHARAEWGTDRSPVRPFSTHYPPVSIREASRDPKARQAVYILSRRVGGFVVRDPTGRATIPMIVGLAAPDVGRGAYNLLLVIEDGSWRVDEVHRVPVSDSG